MPNDFIHDHLHADVQLNRSINEYDDNIDHDDAMMSQQSHQLVIDQQGHNDVQPITIINQQSHMQAGDVASGHVVMQENQRRLQEPCPVPYSSFSQDVIEAINRGQLKGVFKIRLIRQAAEFYYGMCPHPNHFEYVNMAKTV